MNISTSNLNPTTLYPSLHIPELNLGCLLFQEAFKNARKTAKGGDCNLNEQTLAWELTSPMIFPLMSL